MVRQLPIQNRDFTPLEGKVRKSPLTGFTLIEMIVSLGIFSIVVTTAVGAMLVLISTNQQLQSEQNVMTNLSFALDAMTREIRTGYNYYCTTGDSNPNGEQVQDCPDGRNTNQQGISFYEGGNSLTGASGATRIIYYYDATTQSIYRRIGNDTPQAIVSSGLAITDAQFYVTGTDDRESDSDKKQPTVTIYIEAQDKVETDKTYYLQTTVTQRILDL